MTWRQWPHGRGSTMLTLKLATRLGDAGRERQNQLWVVRLVREQSDDFIDGLVRHGWRRRKVEPNDGLPTRHACFGQAFGHRAGARHPRAENANGSARKIRQGVPNLPGFARSNLAEILRPSIDEDSLASGVGPSCPRRSEALMAVRDGHGKDDQCRGGRDEGSTKHDPKSSRRSRDDVAVHARFPCLGSLLRQSNGGGGGGMQQKSY